MASKTVAPLSMGETLGIPANGTVHKTAPAIERIQTRTGKTAGRAIEDLFCFRRKNNREPNPGVPQNPVGTDTGISENIGAKEASNHAAAGWRNRRMKNAKKP